MSLRWAMIALVVLGTGCANSNRPKGGEDNEGNEVKMPLDQVPPAVRDTLVREANGAAIDTVDREDHKGRAVYETDVMMNGKNWEIKVAEDGTLLSKKPDPEEHR